MAASSSFGHWVVFFASTKPALGNFHGGVIRTQPSQHGISLSGAVAQHLTPYEFHSYVHCRLVLHRGLRKNTTVFVHDSGLSIITQYS